MATVVQHGKFLRNSVRHYRYRPSREMNDATAVNKGHTVFFTEDIHFICVTTINQLNQHYLKDSEKRDGRDSKPTCTVRIHVHDAKPRIFAPHHSKNQYSTIFFFAIRPSLTSHMSTPHFPQRRVRAIIFW